MTRRATFRILTVLLLAASVVSVTLAVGDPHGTRRTRRVSSSEGRPTSVSETTSEATRPSLTVQRSESSRPEVGRPVAILGVVVDESGAPVEGAHVYALRAGVYAVAEAESPSAQSWTGPNGAFRLTATSMTQYNVVARKPGLRHACRSVEAGADDATGVSLMLERGASIVGRVIDKAGDPVADAEVRARTATVTSSPAARRGLLGPHAADYATSRTDAAGHFVLTGLDPAKWYVVEAFAVGYSMDSQRAHDPRRWTAPGGAPVEIRMVKLRGAVIAVRMGELDVRRSVAMALAAEPQRLRGPVGYECEFTRVLPGFLEDGLFERVRGLQDQAMVILARQRGDEVAPTAPKTGALHVALFDLTPVTAPIEFAPVGAPGWDRVQVVELPRPNGLRFVTIRIQNERPISKDDLQRLPMWLRTRDWRPGRTMMVVPSSEWRTVSSHEWVAVAPAGVYDLVRERCSPVVVDATGTEEVLVRMAFPPGRYLVVAPRLADGTPVLECSIHVRRLDRDDAQSKYSHTILFPTGCSEGAEWLPLSASDVGEVEVVVKKPGFVAAVGRVRLGQEGAVFAPEMRADLAPGG